MQVGERRRRVAVARPADRVLRIAQGADADLVTEQPRRQQRAPRVVPGARGAQALDRAGGEIECLAQDGGRLIGEARQRQVSPARLVLDALQASLADGRELGDGQQGEDGVVGEGHDDQIVRMIYKYNSTSAQRALPGVLIALVAAQR